MKDNINKYWVRFLVGGIVLFFITWFFYGVLRENETIDEYYVTALNYFARMLLFFSEIFTELLGFEVVTYGKTIRIIDGLKAHGVYLDRGCMGRNVMLAYAGLIAVFPGSWKHKIWYIPMGLAIITFVNILRISGLAITAYCCPEYSEVNHHLVFKIVAWGVIFILWKIWFDKFSPFSNKSNQKNK